MYLLSTVSLCSGTINDCDTALQFTCPYGPKETFLPPCLLNKGQKMSKAIYDVCPQFFKKNPKQYHEDL